MHCLFLIQGQLYDYWQPVETFRSSQEDGEVTLIQNEDYDEEEATLTNKNEVIIVSENEEEKKEVIIEAAEDIGLNKGHEDIAADGAKNDTSRPEKATVQGACDLDQTKPVMPSQALDEQMDAYRTSLQNPDHVD